MIASTPPPTPTQAINTAAKVAKRQFRIDADRRWRHWKGHCNLPSGAKIWRCSVSISGGKAHYVYKIRVKNADGKVVGYIVAAIA